MAAAARTSSSVPTLTSTGSTHSSSGDGTMRRTTAGYVQRRTRYESMRKFSEMLALHRDWWALKTLDTREALPDPRTLDARGNDLSLAELHTRANVGTDITTSKAAASRMTLNNFDTYIACFSTRAPTMEMRGVQDDVVKLHDAGFLVTDFVLPPPTSAKDGYARGRTYVTGLLEKELADYVKIALDESFEYDTFITETEPWFNVPRTPVAGPLPKVAIPPGISLCVSSHGHTEWAVPNGIRTLQTFPYVTKLQELRDFLGKSCPLLMRHLSRHTVQMTIVDHHEGRANALVRFLAKILRNRFKVDTLESRSKGENLFRPAQVGLRRERERREKQDCVRSIQKFEPEANVLALMSMTLEQLRDWTLHLKDLNEDVTTTTITTTTTTAANTSAPPTKKDPDNDDDDDDDEEKVVAAQQPVKTDAKRGSSEDDEDDDDDEGDERAPPPPPPQPGASPHRKRRTRPSSTHLTPVPAPGVPTGTAPVPSPAASTNVPANV